jgi:hypothetical protein
MQKNKYLENSVEDGKAHVLGAALVGGNASDSLRAVLNGGLSVERSLKCAINVKTNKQQQIDKKRTVLPVRPCTITLVFLSIQTLAVEE